MNQFLQVLANVATTKCLASGHAKHQPRGEAADQALSETAQWEWLRVSPFPRGECVSPNVNRLHRTCCGKSASYRFSNVGTSGAM